MVRRRVTIALLLSIAAHVTTAQVRLDTRIDSTHYRIGDWIRIRVTALMAPSVSSISPIVKDSLGPFEILRIHSAPLESEKASKAQVWNIRLTTFSSGALTIPPMEFGYTEQGDSIPRTAHTSSIEVTVDSVYVDTKADIKDIKEPLTPPWAFEDFIPYLIGLLVAIVLAGAYLFYRWRKKKRAGIIETFKPALPPHEQALMSLRQVEDKRLWQQGKVKEYYSEVTEIVRRFFEGRLQIIALEMTSDEILQQLKSVSDARPVMKEINTFLLTADLVKFAKYGATPGEHEQELKWAYEIVRAMIPKAPVEVEEKAEAKAHAR